MKNLAIIIGREGSKRIKNKNFKKFHGKSIVEWSIDALEKTNLFDKIIFSTDKDKAKIKSKKINEYIFFKRPKKLSNDNASTNIAVNHSNKWNFVSSATKYSYPIERSFKITNNKSIKMNFPNNYSKKTQLFRSNYHDAGQFYWGKIDSWLKNKKFFDKNSTVYLLPSYRVQDIDTIDDWKNAENIFKYLYKK